jgi:protein-serine/threonine kinase
LFDHILAHRYLKEKDACKLFSQLISGVWYIHEKKIVHRDLKLENLLLDRNRNVIITDFGFANRFEHRADDLMQTSCGSPCYAAPELVISEGLYVGSAVDIWSCGVILYAMLAGYLPFDDDPANPDGDNINLLYRYIVNTPLTFPDYVSAEARDLLSIMLVPDPVKRADMEQIKAHPWLRPYQHLFNRTVEDLERLAMEQHQMKRLAYQRQMRQQAAAAAEQSKIQRSQSARVDPPIGGSTSSRSRHQQHPPPSMNQEYLYETNQEEPLFTTAPPVPPTTRRNAASAVVVPTIHNQVADEDPFAPSPGRDTEPRSRKSKESTGGSRTPRKAAPPTTPTTTAPVNMSPERERRKADRQRHTIQLEYGGGEEPEEAPRQRRSSRSRQQQQPPPEADIVDNGVVISDAIIPGSSPTSPSAAMNYPRQAPSKASVKVDRNGSISRGTGIKPLPNPPNAQSLPPVIPASGPKKSASVSKVGEGVQDSSVLSSVENQQMPKLPTVNVAPPASPPRMENLPPSSYVEPATMQEKVVSPTMKNVSGSVGSNTSQSSRHRRGISVDKFVGKLWNSSGGSDNEGAYTNGIGKGMPAEAQISVGQGRIVSEKTPSPRPSTLQVSAQQSTDTDKSSTNEGRKSRRNTLQTMVEPFSKLSRQRTKTKTTTPAAATEATAATPVRKEEQVDEPVTPANVTQAPKFPPPVQNSPIGNIPASTSKASKVMQWFRYKSKGRTPSSGPLPAEELEDVAAQPEEVEDRSATPTQRIENAASSSTDTVNQPPPMDTLKVPGTEKPKAPAMGTRPQATDSSVPPTPHVASRAFGVLSSFVSSPGSSSRQHHSGGATAGSSSIAGGFNRNAMRVHHGAVDHTTVTNGAPPDVMKNVTKVLLDMGLEVEHESEYKYRCVRPKKRKASSAAAGGSGLAAFTMAGSAASNGVSFDRSVFLVLRDEYTEDVLETG